MSFPAQAPVEAPLKAPTDPFKELEDIIHSHPINTQTVDPVAHFGGCWDGVTGTTIFCTTNPSRCENPAQPFRSGLARVEAHDNEDSHCHADDIKDVSRCSGRTFGTCLIGGCNSAATTAAGRDPTCNLVSDTSNIKTLYGACQEAFTKNIKGCFYSEIDCAHSDQINENWLPPDDVVQFLSVHGNLDTHFSGSRGHCDCSDVRVGACRTKDGLVCAVDQNQCGPNEAFVSARTLLELPQIYGSLDCRLCERTAITSSMTLATQSHITKKLADLNDDGSTLDEDIGNPGAGGGSLAPNEAGLIAGAVIGGIMGLLILVCAGICMYKCCNSGAEPSTKSIDDIDIEHDQTGLQLQENVAGDAAGADDEAAVHKGTMS